jgi:methylation protein EvaC
MKCKINNDRIKPFMSFGKMPIANGFLSKKNFNKEYFYEMEVGFSKKLSLFQLNGHPKPKQMFNKNYPFFTGSSRGMTRHFYNYANWIKKNYGNRLKKLLEIGSNDGTFLKNFKKDNIEVIGIEPSKNVADVAKKSGIRTINKFFSFENVKKLKGVKNTVDIISAANVICHIPDLKSLIKGVKYLLKKDGLFIFEEPYLGSMYKKTSYDQIYDEHIYMFSVTSIKKIFTLFGCTLIDVLPQTTHGGSMRYVISKSTNRIVHPRVSKYLTMEKKKNIDTLKGCMIFKQNCEKSKKQLQLKISKLKKQNKKIAGYAATSKSTTILNYCDIGLESIDYICDTTQEKIGKYSPGKHIPIKPVDYFHKNPPDVAFLFAWNHKKEIFKKEKNFSKHGKWIAHVKL